MFFSCLFGFTIQLVCGFNCGTNCFSEDGHEIDVNLNSPDFAERKETIIKETKGYKILFSIFFLIFIILDIFPFLSSIDAVATFFNFNTYEGGALVTVMTLLVLAFWIYLYVQVISFNVKSLINTKVELINQQQELIAQKTEIELLKSKYGDDISVIKLGYGELVVSEKNQIVIICRDECQFSDILKCELFDNAKSVSITTTNGKAQTSTGNMLGRAVIGGIVTGGLGAVAGAATAKKNISSVSTNETITNHDYIVFVNVNSLSNTTVSIKIGSDHYKAYEIFNLLNVIVERNRNMVN